MEGSMRGEYKDLPVGGDFENGAAAVAHVEIVLFVERQASGHAHAFHENRHIAGGGHLVNDAFEAAGNVEHTLRVESEAGSVHHIVDERLDTVIQVDLVNGYGHFLAARAAERSVDVAEGVHRRIANGMQIVGNRNTDIAGPCLARQVAVLNDEFALRNAVRHPHNQKGIGTDDERRRDFTDGDPGTVDS